MSPSCGHRRFLIAGAYRTTEVVTRDPLADVLGAMQAEAECTVIRLQALGAEAIGQLVAAEAGAPVSPSLVTAIAAHTGGNPFFAKEMIRHLQEGCAGGRRLRDAGSEPAVGGSSRGSTAGPGPPPRAVAGQSQPARRGRVGFAGPYPFPVTARAAALGDRPALAALDELLAAGLIRPGQVPERYEFGHALVRQAIYDTLSPSRQARLHRRLAQAQQTARARDPGCAEPGEIVAQYVGQPGPARRGRRGARRARGCGPGASRRSARDGGRVPNHRRRPGRA